MLPRNGIVGFLALFLGTSSVARSAQSFSDLMETMRGFQGSRVLRTAVELDIFTAVGSGATAEQVSKKLGTKSCATATLMNALVALGALTKKEGTFHNTPDTARHLRMAGPHVSVRATILALGRFGIASRTETQTVTKNCAKLLIALARRIMSVTSG